MRLLQGVRALLGDQEEAPGSLCCARQARCMAVSLQRAIRRYRATGGELRQPVAMNWFPTLETGLLLDARGSRW